MPTKRSSPAHSAADSDSKTSRAKRTRAASAVTTGDAPDSTPAKRSRAPDRHPTARRSTRSRAARPSDLVLHVSLQEIEPPIWRRIRIPDRYTLHQLHRVLQLAVGWLDYHLYEFTLDAPEDGRRFGVPDPDWDDDGDETIDARGVTLRQLALEAGARFQYVYDFGDGWTHDIVVERVEAGSDDPEASYPALMDGARAAPPEDAGGVGGYEHLLTVLRNRRHPEHAAMRQWASLWAGAPYDPERFDPWQVNRALMLVSVWGALESP